MLTVEIETDTNGYENRTTLKMIHNGNVLREETDGGEPEDNSFGRDWNWVPQAIRQAYELGLEDAKISKAA